MFAEDVITRLTWDSLSLLDGGVYVSDVLTTTGQKGYEPLNKNKKLQYSQ